MSGTLVQVEFVRSWQQYSVGDRITPNGTLRDWLVNNGYCRTITDARPASMTRRAAAKVQAATRDLLGGAA